MKDKNYLQWLAEDTDTIWWHDSADKQLMQAAIENGAVGMTTNPFLMASALYADRTGWADITSGIELFSGNAKAFELEERVGGYYCRVLEDEWKKGVEGNGGVCAQTNPCIPGNAKLMIEQMKKLAGIAPNIFIKLPATKAGIQAFEEGIALGYNMVATVSFTVPQAVEVAKAHLRGIDKARANNITPGTGVAVNMIGRLDDYIRDVVADGGLGIDESDIIQAGLACAKKTYAIFQERGYPTIFMTAAGRGIYHVTELAGANIIMSISPAIEKQLLEASPSKTEKISAPIEPDVLVRLLTIREFAKAYNEDGMAADEFITYGPTNRTLTQFVESGWNKLVNF